MVKRKVVTKVTSTVTKSPAKPAEASPKKKAKVIAKKAEPEPEVVEPKEEELNGVNGHTEGEETAVTTEAEEEDEYTIEDLDKLAKAHPYGLLVNISRVCNDVAPKFDVVEVSSQEKENEIAGVDKKEEMDTEEKFEPYMVFTGNFRNIELHLPKVAGDNQKFAVKVGCDLILQKLYGTDHDLDDHTTAVLESTTPEWSENEEWYTSAKETFDEKVAKNVEKIIGRIEKSKRWTDEEKEKRYERFNAWKVRREDLPNYDEIYKLFDNPYFRVLHNCIRRERELKYTFDAVRIFPDGTEKEIRSRNRRYPKKEEDKEDDDEDTKEEDSAENADESAADIDNAEKYKDSKVKVSIKVTKDDEVVAESENVNEEGRISECKSDAAYGCLEKLLTDKVVKKLYRSYIKSAHDDKRFYNITRDRRWSFRGRGGYRGRGGFRGRGGRRSQSGNRRNQSKGKGKNYDVHNGTAPATGGAQPVMMMPVVMGPNGQMMLAQNAQPMMMTTAGGASPSPKKKNKNKKKKKAAAE